MTILDELDQITHARDNMVMEWGWKCNEYVAELQADAGNTPPREVLTSALDFLAERYSAYMVRATIAERQRVMGYFVRGRVKSLPGSPRYNHLRACVVSIYGTTDIDAVETEKRVGWAMTNDWPSPDEIRNQGKVTNPADLINKLLRAAEKVICLPDVDPILEKYCKAILAYRCGEDGQWKESAPQFNGKESMDDAKPLGLFYDTEKRMELIA